MSSDLLQPTTHKLRSLEIKQTARLLIVSIERQTLELYHDGQLTRTFSISTSKNPPSCVENSFGTPTGLHRISEKIGHEAPIGAVLKGRVDVGKRYWELSEGEQQPNLVTTRILWLDGLEPGHNQGGNRDSHARYIYIHGTNHEEKIGTPASGGCVQLRNQEMIELFDTVENGDQVYIG
ncbi:L,D-transpeptidase [Pelagicoccus sp. SDUM812002]|uniref:L,D-transpeptidase n=1 Tax=Pelagicoccus sp. SDUM812002 TaxID=3041266 RepID=UPI00280C765D|nr:L,D-transpeptidase [Pelagicoccus sp. SDUM812002]MDQ8185266.1 L,D-transpeptidase [Pelagicoccus sp. SDUM812002]